VSALPRKLVLKNVAISRKGFAGVQLEYRGTTYCIDPGSPEGCEYVFCTHFHKRHCNEDSVKVSYGRLISPSAGMLVKPGSVLQLHDLVIEAVEAYNVPGLYSNNPPHPRGLGVGYLLVFPGNLVVYYTGDTNLVEEVIGVSRRPTVLVLPIGGHCVMTPEEALEAVMSLRPQITIPVHFDGIEQYYKFRDMAQPYTQVVLLR